jgi:hypothetical protein
MGALFGALLLALAADAFPRRPAAPEVPALAELAAERGDPWRAQADATKGPRRCAAARVGALPGRAGHATAVAL